MRLYQKLVLFMLAAAVGPVTVVGFSLLSGAERELSQRIGAQQLAAAREAARESSRAIDDAVEVLVRAAGPIRWSELDDSERAGALRLLARQSRHFSAAVLLDASGRELLPAVDLVDPGASQGPAAEQLEAFRAALPIAALADGGPGAVAMSAAYVRAGSPAAALAMTLEGVDHEPAIIAVELSLAALGETLANSRDAGRVLVLDSDGRVVVDAGAERGPTSSAPEDRAFASTAAEAGAVARYEVGGEPVLAAVARTPDRLGWTALVRMPEREAFASVVRMRRTVLASIGVSLLLLLGAGFLFTRRIARGIERVAEGARALGRGELQTRIAVSGGDEVADLAQAFNNMGAELADARTRLERWNEDLQRCVDERTAELKRAQAALLEAQKLAAIGQLGAGVAHEINNPLASILGHVQLLLLDRPPDDRDGAMLRRIEAQAKRAKEITANLLRFSQQRPAPELKGIDLNDVVREATSLMETQVRTEGIDLMLDLAPEPARVRGDPGHLSQVVLNLVSNARTAMLKTASKRLAISTRQIADQVHLAVADTGRGIPETDLPRIFEPFFTTKDVWSNVGLGLSVSYRIVSEHGGKIRVETAPGQGSTFTVELPGA